MALGFSSEGGIFSDGIYLAVEGTAELIRDKAAFQQHWTSDLESGRRSLVSIVFFPFAGTESVHPAFVPNAARTSFVGPVAALPDSDSFTAVDDLMSSGPPDGRRT